MTKQEMIEEIEDYKKIGFVCAISKKELKRMKKEDVKEIFFMLFHEFAK